MFVMKSEICSRCVQRSSGIYAYLPDSLKEETPCIFDPSSYPRGKPVFREGEPAGKIYLVNKGILKLFKNLQGKRTQIVDIVGPGEFLGSDTLGSRRYSYSAVPLEPAELCRCGGTSFSRFLSQYPG